MAALKINVLHLDSADSWRGGQQQAAYLADAMCRQNYHIAVACPAHSPFAEFCQTHSILHFPITIKSEFDFATARHIARLCRQHEFTIIHAHDAHALSIALVARRFNKRLVILASRRVDFHVRKPLVGAWKYSNRAVNRIITVSEKIRQILIADGVPQKKITTVHSGIDIHKFDAVNQSNIRAEFHIPQDHFLVGTIAALAGHKDYPTLLRAAKIACEKDVNLTFIAVGDGPEKENVQRLAGELNLDRFIFTGFRSDVGVFLKNFDAFVLASKTEGLGTSLLDAQAVGLPIVATQAGGIPEVVKDGQNGLLVPIRNSQALADKILLLKNDADMQKRFSNAALLDVQNFDIAKTVQKTIDVYKSCLRD